MRGLISVIALTLSFSAPAFAQEFAEFTSVEDGFRVVFPGQPTSTTTTYKSEYGADLPAKVYRTDGVQKYSVTVVDYRNIQKIADERAAKMCPSGKGDERSCGLVNAGRGYRILSIHPKVHYVDERL